MTRRRSCQTVSRRRHAAKPPRREAATPRAAFLLRAPLTRPLARVCPLSLAAFSQAFRDFILLCLSKEPEQRPSAEELLRHEFIRMYDDALRPFDMAGFVRTVTEMRLSAPQLSSNNTAQQMSTA